MLSKQSGKQSGKQRYKLTPAQKALLISAGLLVPVGIGAGAYYIKRKNAMEPQTGMKKKKKTTNRK